MSEILNIEEVCELLKVSKRTIQREVTSGKLSAFHVGSALRFMQEDIETYIRNQRVKPRQKIEESDEAE